MALEERIKDAFVGGMMLWGNEAKPIMTREAGPLWTANSSGEAPVTNGLPFIKTSGDKKLIFRQSGSRLFQQAQVTMIRIWRTKN